MTGVERRSGGVAIEGIVKDAGGHDLVEIARIWSRPELVCYAAALETEGIHTFVTGNHYGSATQEMIAIGGYLVRVPTAQLEHAVLLTAELRSETEPLLPAKSLRRRVWKLVALLSVIGGLKAVTYLQIPVIEGNWGYAIFGLLEVANYPFPMTTPGDYRSRSGKLMQLA
jgi:hypothetical protein